MELDIWDCFGKEKILSYSQRKKVAFQASGISVAMQKYV